MDKNTMIIHGAGGAGINICDKVFNMVSELGDGFANVKFNYIDTSTANIDKIEPKGQFWLVKTKQHSKETINGSGSERKTHVGDIMANVVEYLDNNKITKKIPGEYHLVISSGSGGSGSVLNSLIIKNLLERDIPVISVLIGDSSNGLSAINTLNTLASLNQIAKSTKKPLSIVYVNNHAMAESGLHNAEKEANKVLFNTMSTLALFLSSKNEAIDGQDMASIIDQSHYKTIDITPGLYGLTIYSKKIDLPKGSVPTVGRTLTINNRDFDTGLTLLHHKRGYVTEENALDIYKEQFPLHMISYANFFSIEEKSLKSVTENYYNIMNSIKSEDVGGSSRSNVDDDSGLVF